MKSRTTLIEYKYNDFVICDIYEINNGAALLLICRTTNICAWRQTATLAFQLKEKIYFIKTYSSNDFQFD